MTTGYPPRPGQPWQPPRQPQPTPVAQLQNGYGVAGFVLGLIAVLLAWIPIVGVVAWFIAPFGLIFGILGIVRVNRGQANNGGLAWTGVTLSGVALAICMIYVAAIANSTPSSSTPRSSTTSDYRSMPTASVPAPAAAPAPAPTSDTFGDGVYQIGSDIPAGTYKTPGGDSIMGCYWAKSKDGSSETLTDNDLGKGQRTVTVKPGGYIEFSGGCEWTKVS